MTPADLSARYQSLLTCSQLIDTRDHLPLFHSLPGRILEIGCDVGNSTTAFLAGAAESVTSIDINPQCAGNFPGIDKWRFILGDSQQYDTYAEVADHRYDVLYVDGAHDYASAFHDIATYSDLVRHRGVILVHDVLCPDTFPGVWKAFRDFDYGTPHAKYILPGSYGLGVIEL